MQLDKAIQQRFSCKKFSLKKPNWRTIIECIDAARYAPMAGKSYSLQFILVDDEKIIDKLAVAAQQDFIKQAKFVVAVITNPSRTKNAFEERSDRYLKQQAGAAIQNFLLKIEENGLSACWVGHFVDKQVNKILGVKGDKEVEAFFPISYALKKSKTRRAPIALDRILHFNSSGNSHMKSPRVVDA